MSDDAMFAAVAEEVAAGIDAAYDEQGSFRLARRPHRDEQRGQMLEPGIYRLATRQTNEGDIEEWRRIGSVLEVQAHTRSASNEEWGRLLAIRDRDGRLHLWAMPMSMMAGSGEEYRRELLRLGFELCSGNKARADLQDYLTMWVARQAARCVDRCGWHGEAFVLPERVIGGDQSERIVLQMGNPPRITARGTLEGWRDGVAALAEGNSRLAFAICVGFAGPLLRLAGETSGGFTEVGGSSIGKTTLQRVAASVGGTELLPWRATSNGLEALAAAHNDQALVLDELGQATPADLEGAAYMLGNGTGKARMSRGISARAPLEWTVLAYSSGEIGLASKLNEGGKRPRAGQEVRLVDLPADAGAGLGVFEELHGHESGDAFARHLTQATRDQRGTALPLFLERLGQQPDHARQRIQKHQTAFLARLAPAGCDGQVRRVAGRMALVAAAGELATELGITGWQEGDTTEAVARRLQEWIAGRGGTGSAESREALAQVRLFLEQHGMSRFEDVSTAGDRIVVNRAGFRRRAGNDGGYEYLVLPEVWRSEVCQGLDPTRTARMLRNAGHLRAGEDGNLARNERIPGMGVTRVYVLRPSIFTADAAA